ncbi:hypothetical protein B9Z19DRAFT_529771 [Tuber borchii]|uniref:Uncharacterized protein n=1 Tax=Tuber borchii TaxID=42251 RepID=A0A2T6ZDL3_TUBBO|nr:hypothetical protein B9Z19DRAFT_529771 [Tuber borchii]
MRVRMRTRTRCICVMWCSLAFRDGRGCRIQLNPRTWPSKTSGREQSKFICRGRVVEATHGEEVKKQKEKVKRERNNNNNNNKMIKDISAVCCAKGSFTAGNGYWPYGSNHPSLAEIKYQRESKSG